MPEWGAVMGVFPEPAILPLWVGLWASAPASVTGPLREAEPQGEGAAGEPWGLLAL